MSKLPEKETVGEKRTLLPRLALYVAGAFVLSFGVVLCVKCEMGVSPINSIPNVATHLVPLSLGVCSIVFYAVNIAAELLLSEQERYVGILLQLPASLLFGAVIDFWNELLPSAGSLTMRIVCLCGSLFFTALGILMIVTARLVPDPPTGTVQTVSRVMGKPMGTVKIVYDCACVAVSLLLALLGAHRLIGIGIATLVSAVCIGRILALLQRTVGKPLHRFFA